jgi:hypothetical protein
MRTLAADLALSLIERAQAAAAGSARKRKFARLYLDDKTVIRRIRQMAIKLDCRPHDLLVEGINLVLSKSESRGAPAEMIRQERGRTHKISRTRRFAKTHEPM